MSRTLDLLGFAEVALVLLADGARQGRLAADIVKDIEAAAMARPLISEDLHQAHLAVRAAAPTTPQHEKGT